MQSRLAELKAYFLENQREILERYFELLRIPSISTQPEHEQHCLQAALYLKQRLIDLGFNVTIHETPNKPVVIAKINQNSSLKSLLVYAHYDVQPVDPLNLWENDPFAPILKDGKVYARGAVDNKGQLSYILTAIEYALKNGELKNPLTLLIEGEEECGSQGLASELDAIAASCKAEILIVCDSSGKSEELPAISLGFRGIVHMSVTLYGPACDLHSGLFGGVSPNPALQIARLAASFHDSCGGVLVEGFYDQVKELDHKTRSLAESQGTTLEEYRLAIGTEPVSGEIKYPPFIRAAFRPTLEINGIHSGYGGPGSKTVIPREALLKITARLVADQDPDLVTQQIVNHIMHRVPAGCRIEVDAGYGGAKALSIGINDQQVILAKEAISSILGVQPAYEWSGGSLPIMEKIVAKTGAKPLMFGLDLASNRAHSPNENFSLKQFESGFIAFVAVLSRYSVINCEAI
jgi:acetylornithine deacetylase/succinyl-diaminopimelate desuccinylase-like protein